MINPVAPVANWFLQFFNNMPVLVKTFVFMCIGLFVISVILHLINR